ncbi:ISWI chromatin-remodeling complex ATPase ISW1-like [Lactuca sativa]|uniref:ISWI chromatin-remodeling complex ATPase ISW1-like n=1 Tax=Lactuca sativa TaxID=4236 RepID=UPI0022B05912|nr:ISWI chromatin-remodeling complex ATPase ISW1-like [Lactuca sativa]
MHFISNALLSAKNEEEEKGRMNTILKKVWSNPGVGNILIGFSLWRACCCNLSLSYKTHTRTSDCPKSLKFSFLERLVHAAHCLHQSTSKVHNGSKSHEVAKARDVGINSIVLYPKVPDALKTPTREESYNDSGLIPRTIRLLKDKYPDLIIYTDVVLDPYSSYGHDGIVREDGVIMNDKNVHQLCKQAISQYRFNQVYILLTGGEDRDASIDAFNKILNPQVDLQAHDCAHRIGQKKEVQVFRLCAEVPYSCFPFHLIDKEKVIERAYKKLELDALVILQGPINKDELLQMVRFGAEMVFSLKDSTIIDEDIDRIITKGEEATVELDAKMKKFTEDAIKFKMDDSMYI